MINYSLFFNLYFVKMNIEINFKLIVLILTSILFVFLSKNKIKNEYSARIRYLSGKLAFTFIVSFVIALTITEIVTLNQYHIDKLYLITIPLIMYSATNLLLRYLHQKKMIEIDDKTELFKGRKYIVIFVLLSLLTLFFIIIYK